MRNAPARGRWITPLLAGAVLAPALQLQQPQLWAQWAYAAALALGVLLLAAALAWRRARAAAALVLAGTAMVAFSACGLRASHFLARGLDPALEGRELVVTGIVAAMPQRQDAGVRFRLEVESALADGEPVPLVPQLSLGWYGGVLPTDSGLMDLQRLPAELHPGERWQFTARLKAPHGNSNPHGFDYELWLWEQGLQATGSVRAGPRDPPPRLLAATWRHPVERARQQVRDAVFGRIEERRTAGVIAALVVGDQNAIERGDWDIFRATGVAHLMSISGLHITMFAWAAALAVGALWRRSARACLAWPAQHAALAGGALLAAGYALFSGWGVPAQRTVWMLAAVALLRLSGRRWPWPSVWLLAAAVVVTLDPWALLQAGFWLSFVAVGVLFATAPGPARDRGQDGRLRRIGRAAIAALREQWVVTLALTPLTLLLFGQASLVGLVANALAIPWVTLVITPLSIGGVLAGPLWSAAAAAVDLLQAFLQWLAGLPFATVSVPAAPLWAGAAGVLGGLLLTLRLPWHARLLGVPLLLPVLLWQAPRPPPGQFELLAADIGQGNAVLVRTAAHTLVYDSGPRYSAESDAGHRVLLPLLRALDEQVQLLVLSHRDADHTGGAAAVLTQQSAAALLSSLEPGHELQALRASQRCEAGQRWRWDGVDFAVLHPLAADYAAARKPNALSCVLRVGNGERTALLAGDIELPQEMRLLADGAGAAAALRADVLLVPHHGSRTSSSGEFLDAVQPGVALLQAGYRNRFGHPAAPVMARYRDRRITVIESARCGAATWRSDAPAAVRCQREAAPRYWLHRVP
ncbi:DNA internalization-related competence protein ComEC/Rec2 [Ramlibacter sp.]|uniref:DNA internalization-related competence protein ComEC/Rec2 n=1 Tax=Ramlibacter sp. TaxID=1917967 RepID=UPI002BC9904A|nr:DNA internalization-related competence protein ComEC/Rec2 [Ramlibacter sp.]HWI83787.1 DNA internalization-related competence protein ComEC/Rec2 [Ramlibacter sp.]